MKSKVLNTKYNYPKTYIDSKNTKKYDLLQKEQVQKDVICYIGQKLHRFLSSSAWKQLVSIWDSHSEWSWTLYSGAYSCHNQALYVSPNSPAVQRVVLEAPAVPHMPQNQHDKLLITSGHLSVRVRPSVAQWRWTIPIPATSSSSCLAERLPVSQSQRSQFGASDSSLQHRMISLRRLQATSSSVQHLTDTEQYFFFHSSGLFRSLTTYQPPSTSPEFIFTDMLSQKLCLQNKLSFGTKKTNLSNTVLNVWVWAPVVYL